MSTSASDSFDSSAAGYEILVCVITFILKIMAKFTARRLRLTAGIWTSCCTVVYIGESRRVAQLQAQGDVKFACTLYM
jgi:hypothetical protein